jgi:mannose-1-phosphate guanylyltransferase
VIVQPCNRGTGLGILLSLLVIAKFDPAARITCLPSDHFVADEPVLIDALQTALFLEPGELDELIVLGVVPDAPDPGFGYLIPSTDLRAGLRAVRGFVEKPDPVAAASLIGAGGVWNTGIVVGSIAKVLDFYQPYVPGLVRRLRAIVDAWPEPALPSVGLSDLYSRHPAVDFSRDVLERQPWRLRLLTVPPCGWNDVGTPTRLATALSAQRNQVCTSDAATLNAETINLAAALAARTAMRGTGQPEVLQS